MTKIITLPTQNPKQLNLELGKPLYILGANGTGKTTLINKIKKIPHANSFVINANRHSFLSSPIPSNKEQLHNVNLSQRVKMNDKDSMFKDEASPFYYSTSLYKVRANHQEKYFDIARNAISNKDGTVDTGLLDNETLLDKINYILSLCGINVSIDINGEGNFIAKKEEIEFPFEHLSDGERSIVLMSSTIFSVEPESVIFIDEPSKHLHPAIIERFIPVLIDIRSDCYFVIATHDLPVVGADKNCTIVLNRGRVGDSLFDLDVIDNINSIPDDIKISLLGSRRNVIFVEGTEKSLDNKLYSVLLPDSSIISVESCKNVENYVSSTVELSSNNWVKAYGIIDNDNRPKKVLDELREKKVFAIPVHSVEALYYDRTIVEKVMEEMSSSKTFEDISEEILGEFSNKKEHFLIGAIEHKMRKEIFDNIPNKKNIKIDKKYTLPSIDIPAFYEQEKEFYETALESKNIDSLMKRYKIRESKILDIISKSAGFINRGSYENYVIKLLTRDEGSLNYLRSYIKELYDEVCGE